jgi:hypothetical protein
MIFFIYTKHNVPCADKDDIEIVQSTNTGCPIQKISMCDESSRLVAYLSMAISLEGSIDGRRLGVDAELLRRWGSWDPRLSKILLVDI